MKKRLGETRTVARKLSCKSIPTEKWMKNLNRQFAEQKTAKSIRVY